MFKFFIVGYITNLFTAFGLIYSFSKISTKKIELNLKNLIIINVFCLMSCLNNYYNIIIFKIIVAFVLTFLMERLLFKNETKDTFIIVIILTILSIIIEIILSPFAAIFITNIQKLNDNIIIKALFSVLNTLLIILIIKNNIIIKYIKELKNIIYELMNFYSLGMFLICALNIMVYMFSFNYRNIRLLIVVIISLLIIIICLKTIINDKYNNKLLKERNKILKDEHKAYSDTIDECRELKHNLKNELYSLKAKLSKENQILINSIITKYNSNYEWINTLNDIPDGLQGLLYLKINEAKTKRIKIYLNTKSSLKTSENDYLDLGIILGILIDNAIEASVNAKSKSIVLNIKEKKNIIDIEILNKHNNKINTSKIGKKNYSTKEYKSGLGLHYIEKLNKPNIKVNFKIINDIFITSLIYEHK